jgi:hypothetical protein
MQSKQVLPLFVDISQSKKQMHGEQYNNQLLMALQAMDLSNHYGTMGIATAALAGGAAYYYLQNRIDSSSYRTPIIDFKNQSKLVSVSCSASSLFTILNQFSHLFARYFLVFVGSWLVVCMTLNLLVATTDSYR